MISAKRWRLTKMKHCAICLKKNTFSRWRWRKTEGDSEQLQRVNTYNAEQVKTIIERRAKSGNIVREHMSKHNLVENETLKRLLITDSDGQHKNVKNKIRMIVDEDIVEMEEQGSVFDKY